MMRKSYASSTVRMTLYTVLLLLVSACTLPSPAQVTASPALDPFEQNVQLGRGINLGNMLEAPREGEWGLTIRDEFFSTIADAGFDAVRVPIRWSSHAQTEPPYTIDAAFFERVDHVIEQALNKGLLVVINVHHYEEIMADPAAHEERLLALWAQIAKHYQDAPPDLLFEVLNEPNGRLTASIWNELLAAAITTIRETNPMRNVIVGPANWYNVYSLSDLQLPEDEHLIVSIHYYEPFRFTHQGAEWVSGSTPWLGTTWEASGIQAEAVTRDLSVAARWGEQHNRPLYLGEFGAYSKADMTSRANWTGHVSRSAEALGMSWADREFASGFGAYDPSARQWREELIDALIPQ